MLMADPDALPEAEQAFVSCLLAQVPRLADGIAVAKRLNKLLRHESKENLGGVLDAAVGTPLEEFAASLRRDLAAVQAALDLPWTIVPIPNSCSRRSCSNKSTLAFQSTLSSPAKPGTP